MCTEFANRQTQDIHQFSTRVLARVALLISCTMQIGRNPTGFVHHLNCGLSADKQSSFFVLWSPCLSQIDKCCKSVALRYVCWRMKWNCATMLSTHVPNQSTLRIVQFSIPIWQRKSKILFCLVHAGCKPTDFARWLNWGTCALLCRGKSHWLKRRVCRSKSGPKRGSGAPLGGFSCLRAVACTCRKLKL